MHDRQGKVPPFYREAAGDCRETFAARGPEVQRLMEIVKFGKELVRGSGWERTRNAVGMGKRKGAPNGY
jgi:hypothetical protein